MSEWIDEWWLLNRRRNKIVHKHMVPLKEWSYTNVCLENIIWKDYSISEYSREKNTFIKISMFVCLFEKNKTVIKIFSFPKK